MNNELPILLNSVGAIKNYASQAVAAIVSGSVDPVQTYAEITKLDHVIEQVKKNREVIDTVITYIERRGETRGALSEIKAAGCTIQVTEAGVKYDFSGCGDPILNDLYAQQLALKEQIKDRETTLKTIKGHLTTIDETTGEVLILYPPSKTSTTTLKTTISK